MDYTRVRRDDTGLEAAEVIPTIDVMRAQSVSLVAAAAMAIATVPAVPTAHADTIDLSMPRTVVAGAPRGAAPSERLDPRRTGRARTRLPASLVEVWRKHTSGNLEVPPIVDDAGNVIVALASGEIVKLGPEGREQWRARLGAGGSAAPPTLLSDGTIAVVTSAGIAWGFTPSGALRFSTPLGVARRDVDTIPVALSDGGLLVAAGSALIEIDADGSVRARATLDGPTAVVERAAGAAIEGPAAMGGALVTTTTGAVYRFRPPAAPRKIGSLGGGVVRGAMLADDRTLLAIVDNRRLVALDLWTGNVEVRLGGVALDAPPVLGPSGLAIVVTQLGTLFGVDSAGNERMRATLDKATSQAGTTGMIPGLGSPSAAELKASPPVVIDPDGRIAFVRSTGRLGTVSPSGKVVIATERVCASPIAVIPGGEKRLLVACRDGGLWMYGE